MGLRLEGQGRTLHYLPSQLVRLPPPPVTGISLACLRSFREVHAERRNIPAPATTAALLIAPRLAISWFSLSPTAKSKL